MCICSRCFGVLLGTGLVNIIPIPIESMTLTTTLICFLLAVPCVVDGYRSHFAGGTTNSKRFLTGAFASGGLSILLARFF